MSGDEWLPLGEEFQEHIRCFIKLSERKLQKQFHLVEKVVQQLGYVNYSNIINDNN